MNACLRKVNSSYRFTGECNTQNEPGFQLGGRFSCRGVTADALCPAGGCRKTTRNLGERSRRRSAVHHSGQTARQKWQPVCLRLQVLGGSSGLFSTGGILLNDLVDLPDGPVQLLDSQ
jgi:hypothetical protein